MSNNEKKKKVKLNNDNDDLIILGENTARLISESMIDESLPIYDKNKRRIGISNRLIKLYTKITLYIINELSFQTFWCDIYSIDEKSRKMYKKESLSNVENVQSNETYKLLAEALLKNYEKQHNNNDNNNIGIELASQFIRVIYCLNEFAYECCSNNGTYVPYVLYCFNVAVNLPNTPEHILLHEKLIPFIKDTPIPHMKEWWNNIKNSSDEDEKKEEENHQLMISVPRFRILPHVNMDTRTSVNMMVHDECDEGSPNPLFRALPYRCSIIFIDDVIEAANILAKNEDEKKDWIDKLSSLKHGDQINTQEYRGCGVLLVDKTAEVCWNIKNLPSEIIRGILVPVQSEYGERIPFNFSWNNFEILTSSSYANQMLIDPCRMIGESQSMLELIQTTLAGELVINNDPYGEDSVNVQLENFPKGYIAYYIDGKIVWKEKKEFFYDFTNRNLKNQIFGRDNENYRIFAYIYDSSYNELTEPFKIINNQTLATEVLKLIINK